MTYTLPRTERGDVDFYGLCADVLVAHDADMECKKADDLLSEIVKLFQAIDANARKEERERCVKAINDLLIDWPNMPHVQRDERQQGAKSMQSMAMGEIRNMGDGE